MIDNFAIFITTHERPDILSYDTLQRVGYTGKIYIVIDDEDSQVENYQSKYENIIVFNKKSLIELNNIDLGSSLENPNLSAVLYPRYFVEFYAKVLQLDYFIVMDDDVRNFRYRYPENNSCKSLPITDFDSIIEAYIDFMNSTKAQCVSFTNNFMFLHGAKAVFEEGKSFERRSCHNVFLRKVSESLNWSFAMNEDYISALREGSIGKLWLVPPFVEEELVDMNNFTEQKGGMYKFYQSTSSFERAFYATVACPWCCKPVLYRNKFVIGVNKESAYSKIISSSFKKL